MAKRPDVVPAVKGTRDLLPPQTDLWHQAEQVCRAVFEAYNYREMRTPILEGTELFARSVGAETDIVGKEMYTFEDRDGRSLTLRPEATASVVRAYLESGARTEAGIKKYFYLGPMFRRERPQRGRYRQFYQIGAEVLGSGRPEVDVEVLEMLHLLLGRLNLSQCELLLNSVGCSICRPQYLSVLRKELESVGSKLCADCRRRIERNPLRVLDCKIAADQPVIDSLPKISEHWCRECTSHFEQVTTQLTERGIAFRLTPRLVRGLDYYTRTTFEITYSGTGLGAQNALLGGGRYDGLAELLGGPPVEGMGFAIGEDRFLMAVEQAGALRAAAGPEVFVAWLGEGAQAAAFRLTRRLREEGFRTEIRPDPVNLKKSLGLANKARARFAVVLGEEEVAKDVVQLKDMEAGRQEEIPIARVVEVLKDFFSEAKRT